MPRRKDTLAKPENSVAVRVDVSPATRAELAVVAARHGYVMSSLLRLVVEKLVEDPKYYLKKIPKNPA
jgi:hypothetical protein